MNDSDMLGKFSKAASELGYTTKLQENSDTTPYDILSIIWQDNADKEQNLEIIVQPLGDELDGSFFIQFYAQYPFTLREQSVQNISSALPAINNKLPLGHFDISKNRDTLYFRYVLAYPVGISVTPPFLSDVTDMCIYAYEANAKQFEALCLKSA